MFSTIKADLSTCCSGNQGSHRGNWYFPDGARLWFTSVNIYQNREPQRVDLRRRNDANSPVGIYRCDIDVHDDIDS